MAVSTFAEAMTIASSAVPGKVVQPDGYENDTHFIVSTKDDLPPGMPAPMTNNALVRIEKSTGEVFVAGFPHFADEIAQMTSVSARP
ncbi:hypothetical protein [Gordonia sp. WA4-43]|uniref:hypothetical protein n=1 Tax=Gordonia sp. WA4-43 TaxID=2878678 RepID=UPI001CFB087E|nr:hypothetical protein [Gordonia sp. WA4-43]UCZ88663.1 hypothetical protein LEL84_16455 [Gordonia sp. WA4-43]